MSKYYKWDNFTDVYLEDSFVLGIDESKKFVSFIVEVVLTEGHPKYNPPSQREQYCYRKARIVFENVKYIDWLKRSNKPFIDANDTEDYGNIDSFELTSGGYHLLGDWGEVIICSDPPNLVWEQEVGK